MPSAILQLRSQRNAKRVQLDDMLTRATVENRDMSAEEATAFDKLTNDVKALDGRVAALEDLDEEEERGRTPQSRGIQTLPPREAPAIHTDKTKAPYSLHRAILMALNGRELDGREGEVHQEVARRAGGRIFKGFALPSSNDPEIRALMYPGAEIERRDLTTTTGAGGIYTVPKGFVEILRARMVVRKLGVKAFDDMRGNFAYTRQTGTNGFQWIGEGASVTPTNLTLDQVLFTPKLGLATAIVDKQFLMQTSYAANELTEKDLAAVVARAYDTAVIAGPGGVSPLGLINNPIIQANSAGLALGTNGGPITYASLVRMRGLIASYNADVENMAYVSNTTVETALRLTLKMAPSQNGSVVQTFVWEDTPEVGVGRVNGQRALSTNLVPSNLTKGNATNCSAIIYANWADVGVATWDTGVDVIVDPYTGKRSGNIEITMELAMDSHPLHEASVSVINDVIPS